MQKQSLHILLDPDSKKKIDALRRDGNYSSSAVLRAALNYYFAAKNKGGKYNEHAL